MTISRLSRALSLLLAALLCVGGLAGCGGSPFILRLAVSGSAGTFDPQYAADDASKLVAANVFEGLLVEGEDGSLAPGVAESYTVSADGRTYTFTLREDAAWSDGTPVTAADFVFALRRLFTPGAESPYAENLLAVENAAAILAGEREPSALGVRADGDRTLVLTLSTADDGILSVLAQWYCAPCNEAFFTAQRGRYGLEMDTTLYNGPFRITKYADGEIRLRQNPNYHSDSETVLYGANITLGADPLEAFLAGQSAVAPVPAERLSEVADATLLTVEDTTYALLFNTQSSLLGNSSIRLALAASPDREQIAGVLTGGRVVTNDLVPDAAAERGQNYRDAAGGLSALTAGEDLYTLFREGLAAEGETRLPFTELLVPDTLTDRQAAGIVQGCWQDTLGASLNVMPLSTGELAARVTSGDYDIALYPLTSTTASSLLGAFASDSDRYRTGWTSEEYDSLLASAAQGSGSAAIRSLRQAEQLLVQQAVAVPLYASASTYAVDPSVTGLRLDAAGGTLYLKYAAEV